MTLQTIALLLFALPLFAQRPLQPGDTKCAVQTPFGTAWQCPDQPNPFAVQVGPVVPKPVVFTPTFLQGVTIDSIWGNWSVNPFYFATQATADALCQKLACVAVISKPFGGVGGPFTCKALELWLVFTGGASENAGVLAAYWTRNPADKAEKDVRAIVAAEVAAAVK